MDADIYADPYYPSFAAAVSEMLELDWDNPKPYLDLDWYMRQIDAAVMMLAPVATKHPAVAMAQAVRGASPVRFDAQPDYKDREFRAATDALDKAAAALDFERIKWPPGGKNEIEWSRDFVDALYEAADSEIERNPGAVLGVEHEEMWSSLRYLSASKRSPVDVGKEVWAASMQRYAELVRP